MGKKTIENVAELCQIPYNTIATRYYRGKLGEELVKPKRKLRQGPSANVPH